MYDLGNAIIATQINNAHGGKSKPMDFMPYAPSVKVPEIDLTAEEFIKALGKGVKIGR